MAASAIPALPISAWLPLFLQALRGKSGELPAAALGVPEPSKGKSDSSTGEEVSGEASPAADAHKSGTSSSGGAAKGTTAASGGTAIMIEASEIEMMVRQNEDIFKQMSAEAQRLASATKALIKRAASRSETGAL